ncbi:MFS transporter [Sporichthya polymorpha]|uniref:MFS transporter n=1 Tax=Sporichthya polymorpha TaxID=35751 RepID=UPI00037C185C|nr:MFS transporter [Sporichthya polymorpha]
MLAPYRDVLTQPGALRFSLAGFLARLPISMLTLGVVLLVSGTGRSYALAGAAAGAVNLGFVVAGPRLARLVDGYGQAAVLRPAALAQAVALVALIVAGTSEAPGPVLVALSLLSGMTMPSIGGLVRARWTTLLGGPDPAHATPVSRARLHTAFSFESVVDEVIFVVGPIAATLLAVGVHPAAGLAAVLAVGPTGALALAAARATEPPGTPRTTDTGPRPALASPGLVVVVGVFVALGALFGAVEVAVVAFSEAEGSRGAAGGILALYALGSLVAGVVFGTARRHAPPWQGFLGGAVGIGASALAMPFVPSLGVLAGLVVLAGISISPTLISGMALVRHLAPPTRLTEGFAWATTGLSVGLMAGSAAAGWLAEHVSPADGFWAATVAAVGAATLAAAGAPRLRRGPGVHPFGAVPGTVP